MKPHIIIEIDVNGGCTIEAVGYTGKACEEATKAYEEALGLIKSKKKKPEYHQTSKTGNQQKVGG